MERRVNNFISVTRDWKGNNKNCCWERRVPIAQPTEQVNVIGVDIKMAPTMCWHYSKHLQVYTYLILKKMYKIGAFIIF